MIIALTLASQVSAQKIKVKRDKEVDFSNYKTIKFLGWQDDIEELMDKEDQDLMLSSFAKEFKSRGLEGSEEKADLIVSLYLVLEYKSNTESYTKFYGDSYAKGRGSRDGEGWKQGHSSSPYTKNYYIKGTLVLDVHDNKTNLLIWQSVGSDVVNEKPGKKGKGIPKLATKMMRKFPVKPIQ